MRGCKPGPWRRGDLEFENRSGGWFHPIRTHLIDFKILARNGGPDPESVRPVPVDQLGPLVPPVVNTPPLIVPLRPAPNSTIRSLKPFVSATVRDAQTDLAKSDIKLWIDGRRVFGFSYDRAPNKLSYRVRREMRSGLHSVKISASDGRGRTTTRSWRFRIR